MIDILAIDILRYISTFLLCKDSLNMEIASRTKCYDLEDYVYRYKYEYRTLKKKDYLFVANYNGGFKISVQYRKKHVFFLFDQLSINNKQALSKAANIICRHIQ